MYRTAVALVTLAPSLAFAEAPRIDLSWHPPVTTATTEEEGASEEGSETEGDEGRQFKMEVSFRSRYVFVPRSIFNIWYFDESDSGFAATGQKAPKTEGYSLGLEFVVKGNNANGIFYVEWIESLVTEGYWDDREEPPDHQDGDYLVPSSNMGIVTFGADYAYEAFFVHSEDTNGAFALSFLVGGGLGLGIRLGEFERWGPGPDGTPGYVRYDAGDPSDGAKEGIPKVIPMVDINAGLRFTFGDRVVLRLEGGLHSLIYGGGTLGVMF